MRVRVNERRLGDTSYLNMWKSNVTHVVLPEQVVNKLIHVCELKRCSQSNVTSVCMNV